jgi:sugar phosphate isomerase/epimerase
MTNRRQFIASTATAAAAATFATPLHSQTEATQPTQKILAFTKPFNSLSFDELADRLAEIGFDGLEATIRRGGNVESKEVEDKLPALVEALQQRGLELSIMTSDINDPDDPLTEKVLRTASTLGIERYRMKYLNYNLKHSVLDQIAAWKPRLKDLAAINHQFGVGGLYQNHSGSSNFGSVLWDLQLALDGISPTEIGVAYDIRHAMVEGGESWPITFNMIRPQVGAVYVKDFVWRGNSVQNVPLGKGRVEAKFFEMLRESDFHGPISLHVEYLDHGNPALVPKHLAALKTDLAQLREWL